MSSRFFWLPALLCALCLAGTAPAQEAERPKHVEFSVAVVPADPFAPGNAVDATGKLTVRRGDRVLVVISGKPLQGYHTYPVNKLLPGQNTAQASRVRTTGKAFASLWGVEQESEPQLVEDPKLGKSNEFDAPFTWGLPVLVRPDAQTGPVSIPVKINLQACKTTCILEEFELTADVMISEEPALELDAATKALLAKFDAPEAKTDQLPPRGGGPSQSFSVDDYEVVGADQVADAGAGERGMLGLVLAAVLGGFISLATPCVFPMIPITVSVFVKQSESEGGSLLAKAIAYSLTLIVVLTIGGIVLGSVLQTIAQHWITNLFLTGVFVFFGLSLLGAYDITLPSWMSDMTSSGEGKGGVMGVVFMALTFSIVSFACVGPIYGGFTALSAAGNSAVVGWTYRIVGPLAFSTAFASPFFVLALFPGLLKSMPKSGSWMNTVKVVMGFLELAAALKFLRAAEVNFLPRSTYFTFDVVLTMYVALSLACALYLFGLYRLPHDHEAPESISVSRLMFGLLFLTLSVYFLPGLFKDEKGQSQKPRGVVFEWTRAFLLPDDEAEWSANLQEALSEAERDKKLLFIDFTGFG
jgi:thiol:disulfide interchange protein DsbD